MNIAVASLCYAKWCARHTLRACFGCDGKPCAADSPIGRSRFSGADDLFSVKINARRHSLLGLPSRNDKQDACLQIPIFLRPHQESR